MSDAILKHKFSREYKAVDCPRTNKNDYKQAHIVHFCARVPTVCLNSRLGTVREKSVYTLVPIVSTVHEHRGRALRVNAALL